MACGRMVKAYCFAQTTLAASSSTVRWSSVVDAAVEPTCASDAHEAPTPVSAISRGRGGRWQRVPAWTVAMSRSALNHLSRLCPIYSWDAPYCSSGYNTL